MDTPQPIWKLIANLGDCSVADYGGFLVYVDETGVYPPEVELYEPNDNAGGVVSRFILEPDINREWFMSKLTEVAQTAGTSEAELRANLESADPIQKALGYRDLIGYFGAFEFDQYPLQLTETEAQERYPRSLAIGGR